MLILNTKTKEKAFRPVNMEFLDFDSDFSDDRANLDKERMQMGAIQLNIKLLERVNENLSKENLDQSEILHKLLLSMISTRQLDKLKKIKGLHNYINPWWNTENGIMVKEMKSEFGTISKTGSIPLKSMYLINNDGEKQIVDPNSLQIQSPEFTKGFFRLNISKLIK